MSALQIFLLDEGGVNEKAHANSSSIVLSYWKALLMKWEKKPAKHYLLFQ
jgi:hypothetical protein